MNSKERRTEVFSSAIDLATKRGQAGDKYIIIVFREKEKRDITEITKDENTPTEIKTYLKKNHHNINVIKKFSEKRLRQVPTYFT